MSALRMKSPVAPNAKPSGQHDHAVSSKCIGVNSRSRSSSVSEDSGLHRDYTREQIVWRVTVNIFASYLERQVGGEHYTQKVVARAVQPLVFLNVLNIDIEKAVINAPS